VESCGDAACLIDELLATARAVAAREASPTGPLSLPHRRARTLALRERDLARAAALDFVGDSIGVLAGEDAVCPAQIRSVAHRLARQLGMEEDVVAYRMFVGGAGRLVRTHLPTADAAAAIVSLVAGLAPASAVSLWQIGSSGRTKCVAGAGRGSRGGALRTAAQAALDGVLDPPGDVRCAVVDRWDAPHAVLVARIRSDAAELAADLLAEAASTLTPVFERDALFTVGATRERRIGSAADRRLARVGFDLHDGPLQELCAFADDIRLLESQVDVLVEPECRDRIRGRFDDLEARVQSLDSALRQLVASLESTTALEPRLEDTVRAEVDALRRADGIGSSVAFEGDLTRLTNSQKIVMCRVIQEALANVRKHSGATHVSVRVESTRRFLRVSIDDNGCGFDVEETVENVRESGHFGLAGVVGRVRLLGGDLEISAGRDAGTTIRATIPHWSPVDGSSSAPYAAAV